MIEIKNKDDVKLIKEISEIFGSDIDINQIKNDILNSDIFIGYKNQIEEITNKNAALEAKINELVKQQKSTLEIIQKLLNEVEKEKNHVPKTAKEIIRSNNVPKRKMKSDKEPFAPYKIGQVEYHAISRDGSDLVHTFVANKDTGAQKHLLPINVFELLIIIEKFVANNEVITKGEAKEFCSHFGITIPQFSKIFHNLVLGKFDDVVKEINKMITDSVFTLKKSHIYRNNHDTNMDPQEFRDLYNIFANSKDPSFVTIEKLIKEKSDEIDAFDLLISLKASAYVFKAIEE